MKPTYYIGLMSGTSADAIDTALVAFEAEKIHLIDFISPALPATFQQQLGELNQQPQLSLHQLCTLHAQLGQAFADTAQQMIQRHPNLAILAIGSHGQTLYHAPDIGMSLQLGHPALIAKHCALPTAADFRIDDMALGGQGAPLAPVFHRQLFPHLPRPHVLVNIGGIANISLIHHDTVLGYDTGPGNALMDEVCRHHFACDYDKAGALAAQAQPDAALLQHLLAHPYFQQRPPKSTGRDLFNQTWLAAYLKQGLDPLTLLSTLNQFSVESLARALEQHTLPHHTPCIICGGGAYNTTLLQRLQTRLPSLRIQTSLDYAIEPNAIEAMMCAWLAHQRVNERPIDLRLITGSQRPAILGGLWQP
ncbi:MAG: anhydro-N-acetylmuramic acid kinase [Thiomicrospira sp.]